MKEVTSLPSLPKRKADTHKGDYGRGLVLAGSLGMAGAACMCSEAALRGGAGLVTLGIPESLYPTVASKLSFAVMTRPLPETAQKTLSYRARLMINELTKGFDVLALGPGLSKNPETQRLVLWLMENVSIPMVVDADALNAVAAKPGVLCKVRSACIVTPHPGEMARLLGWTSADEVQKDRRKAIEEFLKRYPGLVLVLKGYQSIVAESASGGQFFVNPTGNPGMATAGTGDVLTGLIAALLAQGTVSASGGQGGIKLSTFEAAQLGVYIHGLGPRRCRKGRDFPDSYGPAG